MIKAIFSRSEVDATLRKVYNLSGHTKIVIVNSKVAATRVPSVIARLDKLHLEGQKLEFVKLVRPTFNLDLRAAVDVFESWGNKLERQSWINRLLV